MTDKAPTLSQAESKTIIQERREQLGLSLSKLASLVPMSKGYLSQIENKQTSIESVSFGKIKRISELLYIELNAF